MATFNVDSLDFVDDEEARFGADTDFATRFDSANSRLELEDLTNATVGYVPQDVGTDLVGGKFAETVSEGKALADDGNVYDTIQDASSAANSWVKVGPGDFRENITVVTSGLTITGSGERTSIKGKTNTDAIYVSTNNVSIRNLTIDGVGGDGVYVDSSVDGLTIDDVKIVDINGTGINAIDASNVIVTNCDVIRPGSLGVQSGDIQVGNYVEDAGSDGLYVHDDDSVMVANTVNGAGRYGIRVYANDCICGGNRVTVNDGDSGIDIAGVSTDSIVFNNRVSGSATSLTNGGTNTTLDANLTTN
jgi:hypothetical protein